MYVASNLRCESLLPRKFRCLQYKLVPNGPLATDYDDIRINVSRLMRKPSDIKQYIMYVLLECFVISSYMTIPEYYVLCS